MAAQKQKERYTFEHHEPSHSLHKNKSNSHLFLFVEPVDTQNINLRLSQGSPLKKTFQPKNNIQYLSYPSIFRNKTTNIRKILKYKQNIDHFHPILPQHKENKFSFILQHRFSTMDYYNTDYILRRNGPSRNITCRGAQLLSTEKRLSSSMKKEGVHCKGKGKDKRKIEQRLTEPADKYLKSSMMGVSGFNKEIDIISLSPW